MKSRAQPFDCSIAAKTVGISLRHGGGLQEPSRMYVRCDERDCQYVDLNEAPCPLRPEMFADGSDRIVAGYVRAHAGDRVCFGCLTEKLGITHDQVRRTSWHLKDEPGMSIRPARCVACRLRRVTIGFARDARAEVPERAAASPLPEGDREAAPGRRALGAYLRGRPGFWFCAHCLARALTEAVSLVREDMWSLERDPAYPIRTTQCVSCLLVKRVIRFDEQPPEDEAPARIVTFLAQAGGAATCASCIAFSTDLPLATVRRTLNLLEPVRAFERRDASCDVCGRLQPLVVLRAEATTMSDESAELGAIVSGHVRHRGAHIHLLSFRVRDGWRPFALVKTGAGARVPDMPAIFLSVMPTKLEADGLAVAHARAWIDNQTP